MVRLNWIFRPLKYKYILICLLTLCFMSLILYSINNMNEFENLQLNERNAKFERITKVLKSTQSTFNNESRLKVEIKNKTVTQENIKLINKSKAVVEAMIHSWKAYKAFAWGMDEVYPLTNGSSTWMGAALTMIDSLDLLFMMNLKTEFQECMVWIRNELHFELDKRHVNVFETTIRVLGGLLSAYDLSKENVLLEKALDLGDRLLSAFSTPTGLPMSDINLKTRVASNPEWTTFASSSEAYTVILELYELSRLSGKPAYRVAAEKIVKVFNQAKKKDGLVPISIDPSTGEFRSQIITLGARGDSYYEYLLKYWIQTGKTNEGMRNDYINAVQGIRKHLVQKSVPNGLVYIAELVPSLHHKMDHLVCFLPGLLALGTMHGMPKKDLELARQLMSTCYRMYAGTPTGLSPEIVYFNRDITKTEDIVIKEADKFNLQRPETMESLFYLYRATRDPIYQEWGWRIFQAFQRYTRVPWAGYVSIGDVLSPNNVDQRSKCESFWFSETLKYMFLLLDDDQTRFNLHRFVFNTEGHPFPIVHTKHNVTIQKQLLG